MVTTEQDSTVPCCSICVIEMHRDNELRTFHARPLLLHEHNPVLLVDSVGAVRAQESLPTQRMDGHWRGFLGTFAAWINGSAREKALTIMAHTGMRKRHGDWTEQCELDHTTTRALTAIKSQIHILHTGSKGFGARQYPLAIP